MEQNKFTYRDGVTVYLLATLGALAYQVVLAGVFEAFKASHLLSSVDWLSTLMALPIQVIFFLTAFLYCRNKKTRFEFTPKRLKPLGYIMPAVCAVVAMFMFYLAHMAFAVLLDVMNYESAGGIELNTVAGKIIGVIVTVIAAPIGEEMVFRGALLSGLKEKFKAPVAIILSGLAFSLMHMNPEQTVYQFLLGCACAYLVLQSGSLIPAMIAHGTSNLLACLMEIIPPFGKGVEFVLEWLMGIPWLFAIMTVVLFAAAAVIIYFIGKLLAKCKIDRAEKTFTARPPVMRQETEAAAPKQESLLKKSKGDGAVFYGIAIGVSVFMWLTTFIVSIATGNGWLDGLV